MEEPRPAEEADVGAELLGCDAGQLRRWLEGVMREHCEKVSQRAFALADAQ